MKKLKKLTWKDLGQLLLVLSIAVIFSWRDLQYFITGWKPLDLEDGWYFNIAVSQRSGSLVADDYLFLDHNLYYYPEGVSNPLNYKLYNLKGKKPRGQICFYDHEEKFFTPGPEKIIFNLNSGEYEDLPDVVTSRNLYDCTTLGNGDLLIAAEQSLIFHRPGGWETLEIPDLYQHYQVTEDQKGVIWIGTSDGHLLTYNVEQDILTTITDLLMNPVVSSIPFDDQEDQQVKVINEIQSLPDGRLLIEHGSRQLFVWGLVGGKESIIQLDVDADSFIVDQDSGLILVSTNHIISTFEAEDYSQKRVIPLYLVPDDDYSLGLDSKSNILYIGNYDGVYYREIRD